MTKFPGTSCLFKQDNIRPGVQISVLLKMYGALWRGESDNGTQLKPCIHQEREKIPLANLQQLISSVLKQLQSVIKIIKSHLSIGCCTRTVKAYECECVWVNGWMKGINCTVLWIKVLYKCSPFTIYILWWTLCIHSGEVFSWLLTLTHIHLPPGECSWSGQLLWRGFSSPEK